MTISKDKDTQLAERILDLDLILVIALSFTGLAFLAVAQLSDTIIRTGLEIAILLFVPGYSLVAAIYPGKTDITGFERVALSFGVSIAVVPLLAYGLNFTAWDSAKVDESPNAAAFDQNQAKLRKEVSGKSFQRVSL